MKKLQTLIIIVFLLVGLTGMAQQLYHDAAAHQLHGNPKSLHFITDTSWNRDGSIVGEQVIRDANGYPQKISNEYSYSTYVFDSKGRLSQCVIYFNGQIMQSEKYRYASPTDMHPQSLTITFPGGEIITQGYTYKAIDTKGNWTECIVSQTNENGRVSKQTQQRQITYWE